MDVLAAILRWFPLAVSVAIFTVGVLTAARAPGSPMVRAFAAFALIQAFLAFTEWGYRQAATLSSAQAWVDAGVLWPASVAAAWLMVWEVRGVPAGPGGTVLRWAMVPPALFFIVLGLFGPGLRRRAVATWWGYSYSPEREPLLVAALMWAAVVGLVLLIVIVVALVRKRGPRSMVARAFLKGVGISLVIGVAEVGLLGSLRDNVPELATVGTAVIVGFVGAAVLRMGMWEIAPQTAAPMVLTTMDDAVIVIDHMQVVRYANPAAHRLLKIEGQANGRLARELLPEPLLDPNPHMDATEQSVERSDGTRLRVSAGTAPVGKPVNGRVVVLRDVEEPTRNRERLDRLTRMDRLTHVYNRDAFFTDARKLAAEVRAPDQASCLILDLAHFRDVNEAYGHAVGDEVLKETAGRVVSRIRNSDACYRVGPDEFAVLLKDLRGPEDVEAVAGKILESFAEPFIVNETPVRVSASVGYTMLDEGDDAENCFGRAQAGLSTAKSRPGTVVRCDSAGALPETRRALLRRRITEAVDAGELEWYYQPIVDSDGRPVGAEALARWQDEGRWVSPEEFIPAAEDAGCIAALGMAARRSALDLLQQVSDHSFFVTVNLSPDELASEEVRDEIAGLVANTNGRLHVELTEGQLIRLGPGQFRIFNDLAAGGVRFFLDDFGSGYSSLTRLRSIPVSGVKLDRGFLRDLEHDYRVAGIIEGAVHMVEALGLELIVEGVETREQLRFLSSVGCRRFQGYYFYRPMALADLVGLVGEAGARRPASLPARA